MKSAKPTAQKPQMPPAKVSVPKTPDGSWNLAITLYRDEAIEAIAGAQSIPEAWKAALNQSIESTHKNPGLVKIDAHCFIVQTPRGRQTILSASISEL